ncbi:hypothetical protein DY000_02056276 [Brassica cretica]|uniref:Uncharacterized protein n=1 Tax=Brassica cretica TaxID=69181 RepID=A0ABQ7AJD2_BRACR|nr:hypothetical protein DY000_02056276 [Brassica cretica]
MLAQRQTLKQSNEEFVQVQNKKTNAPAGVNCGIALSSRYDALQAVEKLLTALRRLSDEIPTDVKQSVGIPSVLSNLKRLYNGHIYLSATVTWFVGNSSENSDDCTVNRNVVGSSSVYSDEFPTTTTVTFFIGMSSKSRRKIPTTHVSSEFRRKWPTEFRRLQIFGFRRKLVGNPSQTSDDIDVRRNLRRNSACFLVVMSSYNF